MSLVRDLTEIRNIMKEVKRKNPHKNRHTYLKSDENNEK